MLMSDNELMINMSLTTGDQDPTYRVRCHKDIDDVVLKVLECLLHILREEALQLSRDDSVLVVDDIGIVRGVVVLGESPQFILQHYTGERQH